MNPDKFVNHYGCHCEYAVPHLPEHHDRVVRAYAENDNPQFIIEAGMPYVVDGEDIANELERLAAKPDIKGREET